MVDDSEVKSFYTAIEIILINFNHESYYALNACH